jgi:hypothetical protein
MTYSEKFRLNWRDIGKGLIISVGTSVLTFLQMWASAGVMVWDWKGLGMAAVAGLTAYLLKNFFSAPPK